MLLIVSGEFTLSIPACPVGRAEDNHERRHPSIGSAQDERSVVIHTGRRVHLHAGPRGWVMTACFASHAKARRKVPLPLTPSRHGGQAHQGREKGRSLSLDGRAG